MSVLRLCLVPHLCSITIICGFGMDGEIAGQKAVVHGRVGCITVVHRLGINEEVAGQTIVVHDRVSGMPDDGGLFFFGMGLLSSPGDPGRVLFSVCMSEEMESMSDLDMVWQVAHG